MSVRKPHRVRLYYVLAPGAVECGCRNQDVLDFAAIGAGIHPQPAPDSARNTGEKLKTGNARSSREQRDVQMQRGGSGNDFASLGC